MKKGYFKSFDGTKIYYLFHKGKKDVTLVFLHGVGTNWTVWGKEINFFKKKGYSILTLDLRGHGLSDAPNEFNKYHLAYFSRDLFLLLSKEKINRFILVGHSLGGAIAINFCMHHSKSLPLSLILVESSSVYPFDHNHILNHSPYITHFLRFIANHKIMKREHILPLKEIDLSAEGIKASLHEISYYLHLTPLRTLIKTLDNIEKYALKNQKTITKALYNLNIPILIIAGTQDEIIPQEYSKMLKGSVQKGKLSILKKATHNVIVEEPEKVVSVIESFLEKNFSFR